MAGLIGTFCRCGKISQDGLCNRCRIMHKPERSQHGVKTTDRGYGGDWQKLSKRYRLEHPMCEHCKRQPAIDVHHKIKISQSPHRRMDWLNLMSVCRPCHKILDRGEE